MGNGKGIFWKKNWVWDGRLAFLLKDTIDRNFMKTFQVSAERDEMVSLFFGSERNRMEVLFPFKKKRRMWIWLPQQNG